MKAPVAIFYLPTSGTKGHNKQKYFWRRSL